MQNQQAKQSITVSGALFPYPARALFGGASPIFAILQWLFRRERGRRETATKNRAQLLTQLSTRNFMDD
jgi:hypothetical protein